MKDTVFTNLLPNVHPHMIVDEDKAYSEIMSSLQTSILKEIDVSLSTVICLGGMESYLIADAFRDTSLPFTCIAVSPRNQAMEYYLPYDYSQDNASNGLIPYEAIEEINGSVISIQPEVIKDNLHKVASINRDESLSPRTEFYIASLMQILREGYIQGKQIFGKNRFNILLGGYGKSLINPVDPVILNEYIRSERDDPESLHHIINTSMLIMDRQYRGKIGSGLNVITPFLGYDFYRACSHISPDIKKKQFFPKQRTFLEFCYMRSLEKTGLCDNSRECQSYIPRHYDLSESLCIKENILYAARKR